MLSAGSSVTELIFIFGIASRAVALETYALSSRAALASRHDVLIARGSIPAESYKN